MEKSKKETIENIADKVDQANSIKNIVEGNLQDPITGEVLTKASSAEFGTLTGVRKNTSKFTDEELKSKQRKALGFCLLMAVAMVLSLVIFGDEFFLEIISITCFIPYGLYGIIKGELLFRTGIGKYSMLLGWKAKLLGSIALIFGLILIFIPLE